MTDPEILKLENASKGMHYVSVSDYPLELVYLEKLKEVSDKVLLELVNQPEGTKIEKSNLEYFFKNILKINSDSSLEDKSTAQSFIILQDTLSDVLSDIQVYKIGDKDIDVIILGKLKDGKLAGFKTKL